MPHAARTAIMPFAYMLEAPAAATPQIVLILPRIDASHTPAAAVFH